MHDRTDADPHWPVDAVLRHSSVRRLLVVLAVLALAVAVAAGVVLTTRSSDHPACRGEGETAIRITSPSGAVTTPCVLLADSPSELTRGLMGVTSLGRHVGMLFVFPADTQSAFWMRSTPLPLSIAFFATDGSFVSAADMAPCDDSPACPRYRAAGPYRYALEVLRGGSGAWVWTRADGPSWPGITDRTFQFTPGARTRGRSSVFGKEILTRPAGLFV